jgi:hypothetical protein
MAGVLTLLLGTYALAGIIDTPPAPTPPPEPSSTTTGIIDTPPSEPAQATATDPVVDLALTLMQSALLVF